MSKKKKTARKIILWVFIPAVLITAIVLSVVLRPKTANYTQTVVKTGNITTYYSFSGTIAAKNSRTVYANSAVQVKSVEAEEGQTVKKDDVLLKSETGEKIKAPIDGTITEIDAEENEQKMPGSQLCKIVDYANLELDIQVDEYDLAAVSVGKNASITVNALGSGVSGKITDISKEGVSQNGVTYFNAKVSLPKNSSFRVGMTAQAKILNKSVRNILILPMSAVQFDDENNSFVYMAGKKNTVDKVAVELGINDGTNVEVKSGLISGDTVLVPKKTNVFSMTMGRNRTGSSVSGVADANGPVSGTASSGGNGR